MKQEFAKSSEERNIRDPLLHLGMVRLLDELEKSSVISKKQIYDLCRKTHEDNCVAYRQVSNDNQNELKINLIQNPDGSSKPMILSAIARGTGWKINRYKMTIREDFPPESYRMRLSERGAVFRASEIIGHPYMAGAWTKYGLVENNKITLLLRRDKPRHVLRPHGIEEL